MAVCSLQKTSLAAEMNMTEMRPTTAQGVGMGMNRTIRHLRGRSHLLGRLDMTEVADMKHRTTTCVIVRTRGGVADMVKTGGILAGHEETLLVRTGGEALFVNNLLHVRMFPFANKAHWAQCLLRLGDDRSWEPSASWKPGGRSSDQTQRQNNSKKNPRKNGKGKKKQQQQQKREWRADDSQLNKYVVDAVLSPPLHIHIAAIFVTAGLAETVGHPTDRTIGREASASNDGPLREVARDHRQTLITRDAPLVAVLHLSTLHDADAGLTAPWAAAQVHTTGGVETAIHGGDILVHHPSLAAPTVVGGRVPPILRVVSGSEGGAGPGASPPA